MQYVTFCVRVGFLSCSCNSSKSCFPKQPNLCLGAEGQRGGVGVLSMRHGKLGVGRREPGYLEVGEEAPERGRGKECGQHSSRALVAGFKAYFSANHLYDPQAFSKVCYV